MKGYVAIVTQYGCANVFYVTPKGTRNRIRPDATLGELLDKEKLAARLPGLLEEFRKDVESLGFTW